MGSSTPDESRPKADAKSDSPNDAAEESKSDPAEESASSSEDPAPIPPEKSVETAGDPATDVARKLAASIEKKDIEALQGLVADRSGLMVDGEQMSLEQINRGLMAKLSAPAEGGPPPRVAFRCDPPGREPVRTCTIFQSKGAWTAELRANDAGAWHVHSLAAASGR